MDYPLAEVEIMVGKKKMIVDARASDTLPASVLRK